MEIDESKKLIIDDINNYEHYNNDVLVILDRKMDFEILNKLSNKGFSIKS